MYKKAGCTCRVVVLLIKPIVFLTFPLPSSSWFHKVSSDEEVRRVHTHLLPTDYFQIPHNALCLPRKFCIRYCFHILLGIYSPPKKI